MSVWERLRAAIGRLVGPEPPEVVPPPPLVHWRPVPLVAEVACGATGFLRWTAASAAATCPYCRARAGSMITQRRTNER